MKEHLRLARRAASVWRRDGFAAVRERVRQYRGGWRPAEDLGCVLDAELPARLIVGEGNVLYLSGRCRPARSSIARLDVVANGVAHPARLMDGGGFAAFVPFSRSEIGLAVDVALVARLRDGSRASRALGSIALEAAPAPPAGPGAAIAICMATYNPPLPLFEKQVRSIEGQTAADWICIVSDDGSAPETYAEIRRIAGRDPRFRVSQAATHLGFYDNFERCLALVPAGVELVALADHDDHWHPDKLETLRAAFASDTTLVYSDMNIVDAGGSVASRTYWTTRPNRYDDLASLLIANTVTGAASMFRASLLTTVLPFPRKVGEPFHDQWIACVALALGRIRYVDRALYDYVQHSANVLGHFAPRPGLAWRKARDYSRALAAVGARTRLQSTLSGWRAVYLADVLKVKLNARVLQLRAAARMSPPKAAAVRRLAAIDEAMSTTGWLAARELMGIGRVTETLNGEGTLLRGLVWGAYARLRSRVAPTAGQASMVPRGNREASGVDRVRQVAQKIAPLTLRVSRTAPRRVNLLIPTIDFTYFFGGYIAKFNLARRLAEQGHRVRIVTVDYCPDRMSTWREQVRAFEGLAGVFDQVEVALAHDREQPLDTSPDDTFIATTWWTAHVAHRAARSLGAERFLYLIQEYEPFTFPMGTFAALARESYDFPHFAVFSTELLREYFRESGIGVFAAGAEPGTRDSVSFANAITPVGPVTARDIADRQPRRLLFYARPEPHAARNMFELGILALSRAIEAGAFPGAWEFHGLGAVTEAGALSLGGGVSMHIAPRQTQEQYRDFVRGHDVGLSLMYTPHPSLVPIEMASAGMLVVTNSFANKTEAALSAISPNMIVAPPTIEGVAAALGRAAARAGDYESRAAGSRVVWSTTWDRSFDALTMARIGELLARCGKAAR